MCKGISTLSSRYLFTGSTPVTPCFDCALVCLIVFSLLGIEEIEVLIESEISDR